MKPLTIDPHLHSVTAAQEQQLNVGVKREERKSVQWGWVVVLPLLILLAMTLFSFIVVGHTRYIETQSDRVIADTDRLVSETSASSVEIGSQ